MSEVRVNNLSNENNTGGPTISGITTYSGRHFFVPPQGDTASRPEDCEPGSLRFNTDSAKLEYFRGNTIGWTEIEASSHELGGAATSGSIDGRGTRAIFAGGYIAPGPCFNNTDAITIETLGNTIDFNNLTASKTGGYTLGNSTRSVYAGGRLSTTPSGSSTDEISFCTFSTQNDYSDSGGDLSASKTFGTGLCNETRGLFAGGSVPAYNNTIEYVTISALGNSIDFGDISYGKAGYAYGFSSTTRGIIAGGVRVNTPDTDSYNEVGFVTISSTGNTTDFGDLNYDKYEGGAGSSATRGVVMAGYGPNYTNMIEFCTMATTGNFIDFGDLTNLNGNGKYSASSKTRAVVGGGYSTPQADYSNTIEFVNIATTGNGVDFGDFINFGRRASSFNNSCNGHGGL
jgi:hypothetical protein